MGGIGVPLFLQNKKAHLHQLRLLYICLQMGIPIQFQTVLLAICRKT